MVECAFGIMANKWRIFHSPLDVAAQFCDSIVKACSILQNFVRRKDGFQQEDILCANDLESIHATGTRGNIKGKHARDYFAKYFKSPQGAIPWQYDKV
jgi:hypothetical protein